MPYENVIALLLVVLVLLAPLVRWAKEKWMAYVIQVWVKGGKISISGDSLAALITDLVSRGGVSEIEAKALIHRYGKRQLERKRAWAILAELEGMTLDEYLEYAGNVLPTRLAEKAKRARLVKKSAGALAKDSRSR